MRTGRILIAVLSAMLLITGAAWCLLVYQGYRKGRVGYLDLADAFTSRRDSGTGSRNNNPRDKEPGYGRPMNRSPDQIEDPVPDDTESEEGAGLGKENENTIPEDAPERLSIKWAQLLKKNSDVVGWILLPALDLSYPVLQGEDNEKYLHRSISGEYLYAGSIFLDSKCSRSFRAYNTILYGHNMRDGSMFARLKDYRDPEIYGACPYFWIFTPQKDLLYRICSVHPEGVGGSSYIIRFGSGQELEEWRYTVKNQSEVQTGWEPDPEDRVVTLSTCTQDRGTRYTVQGVLVFEAENPDPDLGRRTSEK